MSVLGFPAGETPHGAGALYEERRLSWRPPARTVAKVALVIAVAWFTGRRCPTCKQLRRSRLDRAMFG